MTAAAIIHQLAAHGVQIEAAGMDALTLKGKAPPPDLLQQVRQCKRQLLEHLHRLPKPPVTGADSGLDGLGLDAAPVATPEPPEPPPAPDWKELHRAYMVHAIQCQQCKAAGKGERYGQRCVVGLELWQAHNATPYPYTHQMPRKQYH